MKEQCTEITTEAQYSVCNMQLNYNANMIAVTGLCMITIMTQFVLSHWEGKFWLKPTQAQRPLQSSFY